MSVSSSTKRNINVTVEQYLSVHHSEEAFFANTDRRLVGDQLQPGHLYGLWRPCFLFTLKTGYSVTLF